MMTSENFRDADELVARAAAAFVAGVPERREDDGFFGPASVTWRSAADLSAPLAGLRALVIQALHPLAMAGVDQHSHWREDPVGRLAATSGYLATVSFGTRKQAERAAARVRRIHERVTGIDPVTGHRYAASDPVLLLWVHAALIDSVLVARDLFGTPLTGSDADAYVSEMVTAAELVGVPRAQVPATVAGLGAYLDQIRPELTGSRAASESIAYLLDPPGLDADIAEIWQDIRAGVLGSLPDWARAMYRYPVEPLTAPRRTEIRQALGVLDAVFLGEPGVLEARQRIAALIRARHRS